MYKQIAHKFSRQIFFNLNHLLFFFLIISTSTLIAQNPLITTRLANPQMDMATGVYTLDVEFQSDTPDQEIFGMNVRFFYPNDVLELVDFSDFQGGYGPVSPNPPIVSVGTPGSGTDLFGFPGAAVFVNGAIQLVNSTADPVVISTTDWTKVFQLRFNVQATQSDMGSFCPPIVLDMKEDPANGGFLIGDDGVVITVVNPDPNQDSGLATENVEQFNWDYDDIAGSPYGAPVKEVCLPTVITTRFANPQYDCASNVYTLDVELQSNLPQQELFGMNVRFFYDQDVLGLIDFTDFQGGYGPVSPNPPSVNVGTPASGPGLFGFTGAAVFVNGAIQLVNTTADPLMLSTSGWTKIFQVRFNVNDFDANFCPGVVWDMEEDPADGGFLIGDDGVVVTIVDADPNLESTPAMEKVDQFNWAYDGAPDPPYGAPLEEACITIEHAADPSDTDATANQPSSTLPDWTQVVEDAVTGDNPWMYNPDKDKDFIEPDPGADNYFSDLYERPFKDKEQKEVLLDMDIVNASAGEDEFWYYFRIEMYGLKDGKLKARYAIEADTDGDGCTDWLWRVEDPSDKIRNKVGYDAWGKEKVIAYYDKNNDVGGPNCTQSDAKWDGDGYREKVNDGKEKDGKFPNGIWALVPSGEGDKVVVLAVQKSMIASKNEGLALDFISWRAWAGKRGVEHSKYHLHDEYEYKKAGDPYLSSPHFPIDDIKEADNTNGVDDLNIFPEACGAGSYAIVKEREVALSLEMVELSDIAKSIQEKKGTLQADLFPNPADEIVNIRLSHLPEMGGEVVIYNQLGHAVHRLKLSTSSSDMIRLNVHSLPAGLYVMHLTFIEEQPIVKKFILLGN